MKKVIFSAALLMAAATVSFAGNPKGETKSETKTEMETQAYTNVYWVTGLDANGNYILTTSQPPFDCDGSTDPCKITTKDVQNDLRITPSEVTNPALATIEERQDL